jgi:hypothetical protein
VRNGRKILLTKHLYARKVLVHAVNLRHGTDGYGFLSPSGEHANPASTAGVLQVLGPSFI